MRLSDWLTFAVNLEGTYRKTQFYDPDHDARVLLWDSRVELWLPPSRDVFSWGLYLRGAGIASNRDPVWENARLAEPGVGLQVYPFSLPRHRQQGSIGRILGPLRLFAEYNWTEYGRDAEDAWRPQRQIRGGLEYWRAIHVNEPSKPIWGEIWAGMIWHSANEGSDDYDTIVIGDTGRIGARFARTGVVSLFSPYLSLESSYTQDEDAFWENRLLLGAGLRFAPRLGTSASGWEWLTRLVVFAEYLEVVTYYHDSAPPWYPEHEVRAGIGVNIGKWYR